jgi:ribonuclease HI
VSPRSGPKLVAVIHADESCLGNGQDRLTPGGAGALLEVRRAADIVRRDVFISAPDTTNNRMALAGAIATFALLSQKGNRYRVAFVSDSEYLVKGMREWVPQWRARGWRRRGGQIENLELWQRLVEASADHDTTWMWVRGHAGHAKNEYVNHLAMRAAQEQVHSAGAIESGFAAWLAERRARGQFVEYDPDAAFAEVEAQLHEAR